MPRYLFIGGMSTAALLHIGLLRFTGPDANAFLQGQVSNDTRRLENGEPLLAAYSTAQGRVIALLHLLPHSSGIIALLPREIVVPTLEQLRKFVLRAKVRIEDLSEQYAVLGRRDAAAARAAGVPLPTASNPYVELDGIGVGRVIGDPNRQWVIGPGSALAERGLAGNGLGNDAVDAAVDGREAERHWRLSDIRAGLPQVYAATRGLFVAQMLNLDLIDGISFTKGCYTGQEIIARTQHLGRIKRRMFRLRLPPGAWEIGQVLRIPDGRTGRLTELAPDGEQFEALAVLNVDSGSADTETTPGDAVAAIELPLPYSPPLAARPLT
jgi:folate-binding protein YgfZ